MNQFKKSSGQALIEFVVSLPLLMILLTATFAIGVVMYTGTNASVATRTATENKIQLADTPGAVNALARFINQYNSGSFQINGANIDNLNVVGGGKVISAIRAQKNVVPPNVPFINMPNFNFILTDGFHSALLRQNTGPFSGLNQVPIDVTAASMPATIDPVTFDITAGAPSFVPITEGCTPDITVFSTQLNPNLNFTQACLGVVGCPLARSIAFVQQHLSAFNGYACNENPVNTNDVIFVDADNY